MSAYLDIKEESIKDYNPETFAYESVKQIVIYLVDSLGDRIPYRFRKDNKNDISNFEKTKKYLEELIEKGEI